MKHKHKKRGQAPGKPHHRHKPRHASDTDDTATTASSAASPQDSTTASSPSNGSKRGSVCEYCGSTATNLNATTTEDDDAFDCASDCDRFQPVDVNCVTSSLAFQLRAAPLAAFFCQCTAVVAAIHGHLRASSSFTEDTIVALRPRVLSLLAQLLRLSTATASSSSESEDDSDCHGSAVPSCPFVMLLSTVLPPLRKLLEWVQRTKCHWWLPPALATASAAPLTVSGDMAPLRLLATQLELHDLLMRVANECDSLAAIIEENEERDQDLARVVEQRRRIRSSSPCSSSCSSLSRRDDGEATASSASGASSCARLPQVKKISLEFEDLVAECKFELADLSEAMAENVDALAVHLCRAPQVPLAPKSAAATLGMRTPTKLAANEFVELLVQLVLAPLSQRAVHGPSTSLSYMLPRLLDRTIAVAITEFVMENTKWNEIFAAQFEKAIELFRAWATAADADYDRALIAAPREVPRLNLLGVDAFRRLDILLGTWLRTGKEGESYVPRLTFRSNLEHLRSTIKRTMTARSNGGATSPTPQ